MRKFWSSGDPFIWLTGAALAFCLLMITGMVVIILYNRRWIILHQVVNNPQ